MTDKLALDLAFHWERTTPNATYLTQPTGGGAVETYTWSQAIGQARRMGAYLKGLDLPAGSRIALFSKNCAHWIMADLAIWMAGHVSVPIFPTVGADSVRYVLEHSESKLLFVGKLDVWDTAKAGVPEGLDCIALPLAPKTDYPQWDDVLADVEPLQEVAARNAQELATIVYTSGSTGTAKGVMLSFGSMASSAGGLGDDLGISENDRMLSYLPLSHVFERWVVEMGSLAYGFQVFFAESLDTFVSDLRRAKPTLFVSVPRLWQKFQLGVHAKMPAGRLRFLLKIPIINNVIRKKVLTGLGLECVRYAGSGSAPIPPPLIEWYRALGLELLEGYGMSENFCYSHASRPGAARVGYVGTAYEGVECRISDKGEIEMKSPGIMMGYYKQPEVTAAAFTEDGFFKTGDRGAMDEAGRLKITGRVKELFKTSKGKYVAPAPIENLLQIHRDVEITCVGGSGQPQPHAVVVLSPDTRQRLGDPEARSRLIASLSDHLRAVNAKLEHHEQLAFVAIAQDDWTIENGMLTPTMKIKRHTVEETYAPAAAKWYAARSPVVWEEK
jgi:long-chain acyl-CoA synthetase